jgi:hypothetical protein
VIFQTPDQVRYNGVFLDTTPYSPVELYQTFETEYWYISEEQATSNPEDVGSRLLQNIRKLLPDCFRCILKDIALSMIS